MQHKKNIIIGIVFLLLFLVGCSNSNTANNERQTNDITDSTEVIETQLQADASETANEAQTVEEEPPVKKESKFELSNLPDDFLEFSKYVGQDISVFGVDTGNWDFNAYSIEIGRAALFEMTGDVSIVIGWDNKTITHISLNFDNEFYLNGERYSQNCEQLEELFGSPTRSDIVNGLTNFIGNEDYGICLQRGHIGLFLSEKRLAEFENARPVDTTQGGYSKPEKPAPAIGMTAEEVRNSSWGKPSDINKTTTAYGVHEQWVYSGNRYIYLDDGIVTAIQE